MRKAKAILKEKYFDKKRFTYHSTHGYQDWAQWEAERIRAIGAKARITLHGSVWVVWERTGMDEYNEEMRRTKEADDGHK